MHPILIIQTQYTTVIYIQGQKHFQNHELLPYNWMKLGGIALQLGIQDYSLQVKKIYICENEVNVGVDLRQFPDRVEQLHPEIINLLNNGVNDVRVDDIIVSDGNVVESVNRNMRKIICPNKRRGRSRKYSKTIKQVK